MRLSGDRRSELQVNIQAAVAAGHTATERYLRKELAKLSDVGNVPYTDIYNPLAPPMAPMVPLDVDLEVVPEFKTAGFGGWIPLALAAGAIWFFMYRK